MTPTPAIRAEGLAREYGGTRVLDGLDLTVEPGTVHGLLGPNGAGKTTAVRILATLLAPHAGRATVDGHDVVRAPEKVRRSLGLVGQHAAVDEVIGGRDNLVLFGRLSHLGTRRARARADELLERFGLADAADRPVARYSGGMRRRLDLAAGLILDPRVLLLDEPTTGLDPTARREVWQAVRALVADGTAVLLTSQYLEEVDQLAGTVTVLDRGRVVAAGSPDALKASIGRDRVDVVVHAEADLDHAAEVLARVGTAPEVDRAGRRATVTVTDRTAALTAVMRDLAGIEVDDLAVRRPTLDEVFWHLTGGTTSDGDTSTDRGITTDDAVVTDERSSR